MNSRQWTLTGIIALLAAVAAHGRATVDAFAAAFDFLMRLAQALPLGVWSVMLSLAIATLAWLHLDRKPDCSRDKQRGNGLRAEWVALFLGITITLAQTVVGWPKSNAEMLYALLLGILVGLLAPFVGKVIDALWRKVMA